MVVALAVLGAAASFYILSITAPVGPSIMSLVWIGLGIMLLILAIYEAAIMVMRNRAVDRENRELEREAAEE